jgi:RecB family endonuclease NucS
MSGTGATVDSSPVRLVVARCQVDYAGRLTAHLPMATRVLMIKADGSVLVHSDGGSYKPLNWMSPPCTLREGTTDEGRVEWTVTSRTDDTLRILIEEVLHESVHELGIDPGLQKDGVEKHLQELLADHPGTLSPGLTLVRREYPTAIGPVDLMCDRRGRAADPLPRAAQPRPAARAGARHLRRAGDQAAGAGAGHRPRDRLRGRRLRRPARARRPQPPALLSG